MSSLTTIPARPSSFFLETATRSEDGGDATTRGAGIRNRNEGGGAARATGRECARSRGGGGAGGAGGWASEGAGKRKAVRGVSALCALSSTGEGACVARLGVCISLISPPPPGARWRQPGRNNRAQTNILVHRCTWHAHITARFTWEQTAGGTVRTARSARDHTGTRAGSNGRRWPNGLRLLPGRPTAPGNRVARGGTQGGLNCLTHALPRRLPTPTEEADGNGYGVITGRRGPSRPPPRVSVNLVPLLLTGVSLHPPAPRADRQEPLPMFRCPGSPGFP